MKIVYFTDFLLPSNTGIATSLINLSSALASYGHTVTIIAPKNNKESLERFRHEKFNVRFTSSFSGEIIYPDFRFGIPITPNVVEDIRKMKPDIIHFHTVYFMGAGAILFGKLLKKPIIATSHAYFMDPDFIELMRIGKFKKQISSVLWSYAKAFFNQCTEITVPAKIMEHDLKLNGVTPPIKVIANTVNEKTLKKITQQEVASLKNSLHIGDQVLLYVGRLSKEKSVDVLLESFKIAHTAIPNAQLIIIGNGPEEKALKKLARDLGLSKAVLFLGEINQKELLTHGYYQIATAFVTASVTEVQPVTLIEAFYFGLPVIGVAKKGVKEMLTNVGLLNKPNDKKGLAGLMVKVLTNKEIQKELSQKSLKAFRNKHDSHVVAKAFEDMYKRILERKKISKTND